MWFCARNVTVSESSIGSGLVAGNVIPRWNRNGFGGVQ
jgi:hypothetical protein